MLGVYYSATFNARRRAAAERAVVGRVPMIVLFYHRVADNHPNGWTIDTETFAGQMQWLKDRFDMISLAEAQRRIASGTNKRPSVSITFDDGYAENCDFALPLLMREEIPFTYFVTTQNLFEQLPFPHDIEAGQPLPPNTPEQIQALSNAGAEIGAHTRTHPDLGKVVDSGQLEDEIVHTKAAIERLTCKPVNYFAFPFGCHENMTPDAFRLAYAAGYKGVCSAYGGYNFPGGDPFHIERIHGDPQWVRFKNWMTVDPRKLRSIQSYDPGDYAGAAEENDVHHENKNEPETKLVLL